MAVLHSIQSGNFTTSSTWGLVDATSSLLTAASTTTVNGLSTTATFIPGAITVQGISLYICSTVLNPTGTITVQLYNSTTSAIISSVVINVTDLPITGSISASILGGWVFFKFTTPVTLVAGNSYAVRVNTSVALQVAIFTNGVVSNFCRVLVTTTTQAPAATDTLIISGQHTAAGVNTIYTVTMDSVTNAISYGNIFVACRGTLNYGTLASTTYKLSIAGNLYVTFLGVLQIGSVTTPIPSSSTASLEINCASLGQYSIYIYGGTLTTYGASMTNFRAKLNADVGIGATSSTTDISTGWKNGDTIIVPSTTSTSTQFETITLTADAVGTTLTHTPYTYAHGGNSVSMVQADIGNVTNRNVTIFSTSSTFRTNIQMISSTGTNLPVKSTLNLYWTTVYDLGINATTFPGSGIHTIGTDAILNMQYCTMYGLNNPWWGIYLQNALSVGNLSNNIFYRIASATNGNASTLNFGGATVVDNNLMIANTGFGTVNAIGSNNVIASNVSHGLYGNFIGSGGGGNNIYANSIGWYTSLAVNSSSNNKIWRNGGSGIVFNGGQQTRTSIGVFDTFYVFGNITNAVTYNARTSGCRTVFTNSFFWGGTTIVSTFGVDGGLNAGNQSLFQLDSIYFNNCTFGKDYLGNVSNFLTACVRSNDMQYVYFYNCIFSGTEALLAPGGSPTNNNYGYISYNHNGATGSHKLWANNGIQATDAVIYSTGINSLRITPSSTTVKNYSPNVKVPVRSGNTCTVSVKVRKSITADGTAYNGAQPRLMYVYNPVAGNLVETIGLTSTSVNGVWETLSYTTPAVTDDSVLEFYVDCDGTTGWINIDDWSTTTFNDTRGYDFSSTLGSYVEADYKKPGGSYGFIQ